ncbi:hypothetical protein OG552_10050 [Streptomyces sp. NBC_01476]|uniref:hypothetical protein n=1 Tax=Streptomyces sp. NBC_01476 TaxID=2903881 RepID=UPI002E34643A|nr:hypothetical protein [Streptomyces sp. NBC_01476]
MSTGAIIAVIVAVVVVIAIVAVVTMMRGNGTGGAGLKRRFGPEYERTLARHDGDDKATRQELSERVKRYGGFEPAQVSTEQRERYGERWAQIQAHFVDEPDRALSEADRLIAEVATERGYPAADSPEHFDALSVHHPHQVQGYRQAHALAEHAGAGGRKATEDMRQALVAARALFDDMLRDAGTSRSRTTEERTPDAPAQAPAGTAPSAPAPVAAPPASTPPAARDEAAEPAPATEESTDTRAADRDRDAEAGAGADAGADAEREHHRPLADRFASLTGSARRDHSSDDHR